MNYTETFEQAKRIGKPVRFENDLICNICGKTWNAKGIWQGDMNGKEVRRLLDGKGCPCCPEERRK